ncbi:MAG: hypothetical protein ACJ8I9_08030 [Chthoniobacterales bacterium]
MDDAASRAFRLTVLNPGGRDPEQHFPDGAGEPSAAHPPTNFHAFAACTRGSFHRETRRAIAENTAVLLLLRGDFRHSERALHELRHAGRTVAVSLKETGLHQIAAQLHDPDKLGRFVSIVRGADFCLGVTPEAAEIYHSVRGGDKGVAFIPTPYPVDDSRWDFSKPTAQRSGIFIGTRELDVPSRNHLAALLLARELSRTTAERVTAYNFDGRKGARLLRKLEFPPGKLDLLSRRLAYPDYLRELARHKIVLQLDTSFVPGQVAGDALLARVPCVGGNGAVDRIAFPETCGAGRSIAELRDIALRLLSDTAAYQQQVDAIATNAEQLSFASGAAELRRLLVA